MDNADKLINLLAAVNSIQPIILALINDLRNPGQTDEEVIANARAKVNDTRRITDEDRSDLP